jgi:hypothetical protein
MVSNKNARLAILGEQGEPLGELEKRMAEQKTQKGCATKMQGSLY